MEKATTISKVGQQLLKEAHHTEKLLAVYNRLRREQGDEAAKAWFKSWFSN